MEKNGTEYEESYKVPNLEKGIAVLELLSENQSGMTLQELKNKLEISQTTAYRILNTLVRLGYLHYDEMSRIYRLTKKMLAIGYRSIHEHNLLEVVLPQLRKLRDEVKETVCFGVLGESKCLFVEQANGLHPFSFVLTPGKEIELHCSAPGKAIMAFLPENIRKTYLDKMTYGKYNSRTIDNEHDYLKELEEIKRAQVAFDREEELTGVMCIGAPIFDYDAYPCGSIWISGPKDRMPEELINVFTNKILDIAQSISLELGYSK